MLLAVAIGVGISGFSLFMKGFKRWSFSQLMLGHWAVSDQTKTQVPASTYTPPALVPGYTPPSPTPGYTPPGAGPVPGYTPPPLPGQSRNVPL